MNSTSFTPTHSLAYQTLPTTNTMEWSLHGGEASPPGFTSLGFVTSYIPSVYFHSKQTWNGNGSCLGEMLGCIGKTAWLGELLHSQVILCPNNGNKDTYIRMYTYVVLMPTAYSMHSYMQWRCRACEHTHTLWWQVIQHLSSKFLHICKTVMLHARDISSFKQKATFEWCTTFLSIVLLPFSLPI